MFKVILKWGLGLVLLAVVLAVALLLSRDSILRVLAEHRLRQQAGMRAEIGGFHLGLTEPVIELKQLQLYNPPAFGGTPFLRIPEIYVQYDRAALARNQLHVNLLRFQLSELDIVKSQDGRTNLLAFGLAPPTQPAAGGGAHPELADFQRQTGLEFKGIDCLRVSVGSFKYVDLQDRKNDREQVIGIDNLVISNVVSYADLAGLGLLVGLRSGDFFKPLVAPGEAGASTSTLLKLLGR